jgi:hypothetical protein
MIASLMLSGLGVRGTILLSTNSAPRIMFLNPDNRFPSQYTLTTKLDLLSALFLSVAPQPVDCERRLITASIFMR